MKVMAKIKPIRTGRLLIEPFSKRHLTKRYVSWLNDPVVVRYSEQRHNRHTIKTGKAYLASFKKSPHYFCAISVVGDELGHIGNITAYVDGPNKAADMGILIGETKAWGKGYAAEAWTAVCRYLFKRIGIRKITAGTLSCNKRMLSLMKRAGMTGDGRRVRQCIWEGKEVDVIHKTVFKERSGQGHV